MTLKMLPMVERAYELVMWDTKRAEAASALMDEYGVSEAMAHNAITTAQQLLIGSERKTA